MFKKIFLLFGIMFSCLTYADQPKQLILVLDWFANPSHAPIFVAEQEGYFKEAGLDIKIIPPADSSDGEKMVAVGQADVAITYQPSLLRSINKGLPLIRFATLIDKPLDTIAVLSDGPIHSIKDLKGKRIGYSSPSTDNIMLKTMLKHNGLSIDDVKLINVRFNLTQALLTKKIDAFTGGSRNFEPIEIEIAGSSGRFFYPEQNGFPEYDELILVANKDKVSDPRLKKIVIAITRGEQYLEKHPQVCWKKFVALHPELNNELNKRVWFLSLKYFAKNPGKLNVTKYKNFSRFMYEKKLLTEDPVISSYAIELNR